MKRRGMSPFVAKHLGLTGGARAKDAAPRGRKLPSLQGVGLERLTESDLQRQVVRDLRRAGLTVIAIPNQRFLSQVSDEPEAGGRGISARDKVKFALAAQGMVTGAPDLLVQWDATKGQPGNRGLAWIELKRPVSPAPVSVEQDEFIANQRALGVVAGVAQSYEQAEALLVEAGAPLRFQVLRPAPVVPHKSETLGTAIPSASEP